MAAADVTNLVELDANYLIAAAQRQTPVSRELEDWLGRGIIVQTSSVAWSEYLCGPLDDDEKASTRHMLRGIEPFTMADAELASELFNTTGRRSRSHTDCMIAAHAIRRDAFLATLNLEDFRRFDQLRLAQEL
ncbi:MAG: PIN domain-containing protein [Chthoniobacterales bacterium]